MTSYPYTSSDNSDVPPAPIIDIQIASLSRTNPRSISGKAFLDTGSDCTLIPLNYLAKIEVKVAVNTPNRRVKGVGGQLVSVYPYYVAILIAQKSIPVVKIYGCSPQDTDNTIILGRDVLNRLCIKFDGLHQRLTFY